MGPLSLGVALAMTACGASNEDSGDDDTTPSDGPSVSGTLNGAGSTAQEAAMAAWKKGFQTENSGVTVNYDAVGSGGGREQFLAGAVNFAGSDAYLSDEELVTAQKTCGGDPVEVPVYVSPIAVIYNLDGVDKLQLSPETLADIFAGRITKWNDSSIASENAGVTLPDLDITPVHRSDDSGTTQNFTDYLAQAAPDNWTSPASQTWPVQGGEAGDGTSGVVAAVAGGTGTIGYADESQAGDLGKALIKVGSDYVGPSAEAAGKVLDESDVVSGRPPTDIAIQVNRTSTTADVYPIILVSYQMVCQKQADEDAANLIKAFETYVVSSAGQQAAAAAAGSAPIPDSLAQKAQAAIDTITAK
jgi:phosphate transport system substrate-binding protein